MVFRCAILDDNQQVALLMADWSKVNAEIIVFNAPLGDETKVIEALQDFDIVCLMRERTPSAISHRGASQAEAHLTTGLRNAAIDVAAAKARGVVVSGTQSAAHPSAELVFAHLLEFNRKVGYENARMMAGVPWQTTLGRNLNGKTLVAIGLGRLGTQVARIAGAFGMKVVAWSQDLTPEKCEGTGATYVSKEELFETSDYISQIAPHLGYVTEDNYRLSYGQVIEDVAAFIKESPIRIVEP